MTTPTKLRIFTSETFDPAFNLATEDFIFRDMDPSIPVLFLWRNDKTVVIGRFQNPWTECHTGKIAEDGVTLVRRQSGGGAVYHDLGNTNFTFMTGSSYYDKEVNSRIITNAINSFGLKSKTSGRNDIVVETEDGDKKVSGSAFKETKDRSFHHGTLLINANLSKLADYLNPHPKKLNSKGITSVRARVVNMSLLNSAITHESLCAKIIEEFQKYYGLEGVVEVLSKDALLGNEKMRGYFEKYSDWNWRFGETPQFAHQMTEHFSWGLVEVHLNVEKAVVTDCKIFSDSLHPEMIEELMAQLIKTPYTKDGFKSKLNELKGNYKMYADYLQEFSDWIVEEIR